MLTIRFRRYVYYDLAEEVEITVTSNAVASENMEKLKQLAEAYLEEGKYTRKVEMENNEMD